MTGFARRAPMLCLTVALALLGASPATAELVLSQLIVDLQPGSHVREDVEVWNNSPDRAFVAIEPREILNPSRPSQTARQDPDPEKLGLLVSPARMVLEPGERRLLRVASLSPDDSREHVYRVTVRPAVGTIQSNESGLKILVGYDLLVLVRPLQPVAKVSAVRTARTLTFSNGGNISVEIVEGRQCSPPAAHPTNCADLPGKRLYPGTSWTVALPSDLPAAYTLKSPGKAERRVY